VFYVSKNRDKGEKMGVTRRNFLKGAAATGAVAAVGAVLAGCTPSPSTDSSNEVASAGRWSWSAPPEISEEEITETHDCDVCVVGAGASGNPAALYAASIGFKVVVLQKESDVCIGSSGCGIWFSKMNSELGVESDAQAFLQEYANDARGKADMALVRRTLLQSGPALDWLVSEAPEPAVNYIPFADHLLALWSDKPGNTAHTGVVDFMRNIAAKATEKGATYLYSTPAVKLLQDGSSKVTGVIGQAADGSYVQVNASKGVVLCCGDVAADKEMLECYAPWALPLTYIGFNESNTGDGTKMGQWAGAAVEPAPATIQVHFDYYDVEPFKGVPWLMVDKNGKRFTNENVPYHAITQIVALQPDHQGYQIKDKNMFDNIDLYSDALVPARDIAEVDAAIEAGNAWKADSIAELAEAAGLDSAALQASVDRYNELVELGVDEDFGVDSAILATCAIKEPPFYCILYESALLVLGAGLKSNEYMEVIDEEYNPIPGLYAAGLAQGSFFGWDYNIKHIGFTFGHNVAGGVLAVASIAGKIDDPLADM
jgi:fumarate reductase flavoprotein subunit